MCYAAKHTRALPTAEIYLGNPGEEVVEWKTRVDLSDFADKPVKMQIEMTDAILYTFQFAVTFLAPGRIFTN